MSINFIPTVAARARREDCPSLAHVPQANALYLRLCPNENEDAWHQQTQQALDYIVLRRYSHALVCTAGLPFVSAAFSLWLLRQVLPTAASAGLRQVVLQPGDDLLHPIIREVWATTGLDEQLLLQLAPKHVGNTLEALQACLLAA